MTELGEGMIISPGRERGWRPTARRVPLPSAGVSGVPGSSWPRPAPSANGDIKENEKEMHVLIVTDYSIKLMAAGFETYIPGFPRYTMLGDRSSGVYNLKIANATLEDDAEFQCQVGPSKYHKPIRAYARLSVIYH
ncbi:hypothetical protein B566_EDAN007783 [Ephemera danica]|nr:hypothetical protein B566_EDAN007783 [Ephemera danica]